MIVVAAVLDGNRFAACALHISESFLHTSSSCVSPLQVLPGHHDICELWWRWLLVLCPQQVEWTHSGRPRVSLVRLDNGCVPRLLFHWTEEGSCLEKTLSDL